MIKENQQKKGRVESLAFPENNRQVGGSGILKQISTVINHGYHLIKYAFNLFPPEKIGFKRLRFEYHAGHPETFFLHMLFRFMAQQQEVGRVGLMGPPGPPILSAWLHMQGTYLECCILHETIGLVGKVLILPGQPVTHLKSTIYSVFHNECAISANTLTFVLPLDQKGRTGCLIAFTRSGPPCFKAHFNLNTLIFKINLQAEWGNSSPHSAPFIK